MTKKELVNYIQAEMAKGTLPATITELLLSKGHTQQDITDALHQPNAHRLNRRKILVIIAIMTFLLFIAGSALYLKNQQQTDQLPTPILQKEPAKVALLPKNKKTIVYTNTKQGFSFEYPDTWVFKEFPADEKISNPYIALVPKQNENNGKKLTVYLAYPVDPNSVPKFNGGVLKLSYMNMIPPPNMLSRSVLRDETVLVLTEMIGEEKRVKGYVENLPRTRITYIYTDDAETEAEQVLGTISQSFSYINEPIQPGPAVNK